MGWMLTLTVVIPVLDDAEALADCLARLRAQSVPVEVLVVDNGSTDDSVEVARRAGARVIVERAAGIPAAASTGLDSCTSDLVARVDADTRLPVDWASRVIAAFNDESVAAVTGPGEFYGSTALVHAVGRQLYMRAYFASVALLVGQKPVFGSNYAIRRDVWNSVRVHRAANVHDDMDLSFQLDGRFRILYDPHLVVGISARPITSLRNLARHYWLAVVTIVVNWRERGPWRRWRERRRP